MGKSYSRRTAGVTEKNATFAFSKKTHTNATFKWVAKIHNLSYEKGQKNTIRDSVDSTGKVIKKRKRRFE